MPDDKPFQVLRYENDGEICIITGPIKQPRQEDDERIFHVASDLLTMLIALIVTLHLPRTIQYTLRMYFHNQS